MFVHQRMILNVDSAMFVHQRMISNVDSAMFVHQRMISNVDSILIVFHAITWLSLSITQFIRSIEDCKKEGLES